MCCEEIADVMHHVMAAVASVWLGWYGFDANYPGSSSLSVLELEWDVKLGRGRSAGVEGVGLCHLPRYGFLAGMDNVDNDLVDGLDEFDVALVPVGKNMLRLMVFCGMCV